MNPGGHVHVEGIRRVAEFREYPKTETLNNTNCHYPETANMAGSIGWSDSLILILFGQLCGVLASLSALWAVRADSLVNKMEAMQNH